MKIKELKEMLEKLENYEDITLRELRRIENKLSDSKFFHTSTDGQVKIYFIEGSGFGAVLTFLSYYGESFNQGICQCVFERPVKEIIAEIQRLEKSPFSDLSKTIKETNHNLEISFFTSTGIEINFYVFPLRNGYMVYDEDYEKMHKISFFGVDSLLEDIFKEFSEEGIEITSEKVTEI